MKKQFYIFSLILVATTVFNALPVKAKDRNPNIDYNNTWPKGSNSNESNYSSVGQSNGALKTANGAPFTPSSSTNLPINNGVVFLMIAGIIIGITTLKKYKPALVIR